MNLKSYPVLRAGVCLLALVLALPLLGGCQRLLTARMLTTPPVSISEFSPDRYLVIDVRQDDGSVRRATADPMALQSPDGALLRGWYFHAPENRRYLLFLHGTLGLMERSERFLAWMSVYLEANVLAIDYRGYGFSEGRVAQITDLEDDALLIYDHLASRLAPPGAPLFVMGYSLGSGLACQLAAQRATAGVILIAPFTSAEDFCASAGPWWLRLFERLRPEDALCLPRQPVDAIRDVREPLLIIHGAQDIVVPPAQGRALYAAAPAAVKQLVIARGAGHENLGLSRPPLRDRIRDFLDAAEVTAGAE